MNPQENDILTALYAVKDPEIPTISVVDLGIITNIHCENGMAQITMTPTFTACPAIKILQEEVKNAAEALDFVEQASVMIDYSTPWTSDRITDIGREQIKAHGLATPARLNGKEADIDTIANTNCPHCGSAETSLNILFGPTLCRSMHYCYHCKQAFEAFKPI
ncbi:MAG: phenylacetate-CoA oxygenase subunit PaaJ [Chitinophagales bacterium]|jgi:ring-1,2-phenylacetyl-CoA epoxidase subunit PaaD|nr:phenylacetate-CoA oxygenase subunit PaaJ [Chitinophagales bacterium]HNL07023.1 phenylacetate-CoA oxygenase subunit PaaJ [Chitinophagales bacterium]